MGRGRDDATGILASESAADDTPAEKLELGEVLQLESLALVEAGGLTLDLILSNQSHIRKSEGTLSKR